MKFIVANVAGGDSRAFKRTLLVNLSKDQLTWIKASNLYMTPKLLTTANHDIILNLGCNYGVCFMPKNIFG